ncbi:hypothetical protein BDQ17DRAFT_1436809 [Cyathus striatus]|nr:hypothetical protein BDQ17DRAFT_1436809 [Cyathus striatus]
MVCKKVDHKKINIFGRSDSDDVIHTWLPQVPRILQNYWSLADNIPFIMGIVSGVEITLGIDIFLSPLIRFMQESPKTEIYLFASDLRIDQANGRLLPLNVYFSLDKMGTERLSELYAASIGLTITSTELSPLISYWETFYYEALCDFYDSCGLKTFDIYMLLGIPNLATRKADTFPKSSAYMENIDSVGYLKTKNEIKRDKEILWHPRERGNFDIKWIKGYNLMDKYISMVKAPDTISSLAWIGISALEDCLGLIGTVYETKFVQIMRRNNYDQYRRQVELRYIMEIEEWEEITNTDVHDDDMDHFKV